MTASALIVDGHAISIAGRAPTLDELARAWMEAEARIAFLERAQAGSAGYARVRPC